MTKLIFTPEDFPTLSLINQVLAPSLANKKLEKYIAEHGVPVTGSSRGDGEWTFGDCHNSHTAVVINIEERPKRECEHEPNLEIAEAFMRFEHELNICAHLDQASRSLILICKHCRVKLKPTKWEAV